MNDSSRTFGDWSRLVLRRWPLVLGAALVGVALGLAYSAATPSQYEARATLVVSPARGLFDPDSASDLPGVARTVATLAESDVVLSEARAGFAPAGSGRAERATINWLRDHVSARVAPETSLVQVLVRDTSQADATALARATQSALLDQIDRLRPSTPSAVPGAAAPEPSGVDVRPFGPPAELGEVGPDALTSAILAGSAGLLLGLIAATLAGDRGLRPRRPDELAGALGVNEILTLDEPGRPRVRSFDELTDHVVALTAGSEDSDVARLARRVAAARERGVQVVAMLGPVPADELRSVALGVGAHLALRDSSTLVIDATAASANGPGDTDLRGQAHRRQAAIAYVAVEPRGSGGARSNGGARMALLSIQRRPGAEPGGLAGFLAELRASYRHIVVAGPPAEREDDSLAVALGADANVLVLPRRLPFQLARQAIGSDEATARPLVGVGIVHRG